MKYAILLECAQTEEATALLEREAVCVREALMDGTRLIEEPKTLDIGKVEIGITLYGG